MIEIALYQPDIPPTPATILRLAACLGVAVRIIEPAGFQWSDKSFRRAGMDYIDQVRINRHAAWPDFRAAMHEIESNLDVRRLMFVLSNILVPALAMAMTDCLTGSEYTPALRWFPTAIVPFVGGVLAVAGTLVSCILVRCHFGLVVNGSKLDRVQTGWVGVGPMRHRQLGSCLLRTVL